jgi:hypothetical protein
VPPLAVLGALVLCLGAACAPVERAPEPAPSAPLLSDLKAGPAVVVGTVIEASTGGAVAGARVSGPDGSEALTDAAGRFRIKGMPVGTQGELRAVAGALEGAVRLRPLAGGRLEVVVYVR